MQCSSHPYAKAVATIPFSHKISATQVQTSNVAVCAECKANYDTEQRRHVTYSKEWHEDRVDVLASRLRTAVADWFECDRSDPREVFRLRGELLNLSRSMSSELAAISDHNYREYTRSLTW